MNFFEYLNKLDQNGMFAKADKLEKQIFAANFNLTKKKITPQQQLNNKLDAINTQVLDLKDKMDDADSQGGETKLVLDGNQVEFKEK
jgi:hypothetical protein